MKKIRFFILSVSALLFTTLISAQTAEEIIANYLNAIGGKDQICQITSVYTEGTLDAMGSTGVVKTTLVNGKGFKQEIDVMGTQVVMCYTDSMGWQINPMTGNYGAEKMPDPQFKSGRDNIFAGGPFVTDYASKGYKIELAGQETVVGVNAWKLNVTSPDNIESVYYFDPSNWYMIKMVQKAEMMGQPMDISIILSNYQKPENGYAMPFTMETDYGGQIFLTAKINKVEINQPVDPAIFAKP
ncbi:MAG TPA: hypothetical protein VHI78_05415 [Bacteroidales bacterium]|jgi:hypothetical protein|nr:hypothetical protein [Bacteroidales bacterium]